MTIETAHRAFAFLPINERAHKPRSRGITEIRGPYYTPVGRRYLQDLLETMGEYVDTLKYAGGSFTLMPREAVQGLNELCHEHDVEVSTGGFLEYVLAQRGDYVARCLEECRELGFDIVEISSGFVTLPAGDLIALGFLNQASQSRIGLGVRDAILGHDVQLLAILGIQLRFLTGGLEYRMFAIFKISSHRILLPRFIATARSSSKR